MALYILGGVLLGAVVRHLVVADDRGVTAVLEPVSWHFCCSGWSTAVVLARVDTLRDGGAHVVTVCLGRAVDQRSGVIGGQRTSTRSSEIPGRCEAR